MKGHRGNNDEGLGDLTLNLFHKTSDKLSYISQMSNLHFFHLPDLVT